MRNFILFISVSLLLTGCGKKGALIYPDMLVPAPPSPLKVIQSGDNIKISFAIPEKDLAGRKMKDIAGVKMFKLELPSGQYPACPDCAGFTLFKVFYPEIADETQRYGSLAVVLDGGVVQGRGYSYKAAAFTREGLEGKAAVSQHITMQKPSQPPVLRIMSTPTELRLEFAGEVPPGSKLLGYNLYRKQKGEVWPYLPLNSKPLTQTVFADTGLDRRMIYHYMAKSLIRLPTNEIIESLASNEVEGILKDED